MTSSALILFATFILTLAGSLPAEAKTAVLRKCPKTNGTDLKIPKGAKYQIHSYDEATNSYQVYHTTFTAEGDSWVTLEALAAAVPAIKAIEADLHKKPDDIVDGVYTLEKDVPTLFPKERNARRDCER